MEEEMKNDLLINGFTRKETIALTGCTSSFLAYLEKIGIVIPQRLEGAGKSAVFFSFPQIVNIKIVRRYRNNLSPKKIRKILDFLGKEGWAKDLLGKKIIVIDDEAYWIDENLSNLPSLIAESDNVLCHELIVIPSMKSLVDKISENAKVSDVINFESFIVRLSRFYA